MLMSNGVKDFAESAHIAGTVTALAPSTDLTTIDGTYLSGHIQYLHDYSLESDFLFFCDAEKKVCYEILANCWGWYCQQAQGGTATFCASRRERQRELKEIEVIIIMILNYILD